MAQESFDACHVWLGIPPSEQPPNHYRLLAIALFEDKPEVIANAADRQMAHLRTFQSGKRGLLTQKLLNEIAAAKLCLLLPEKKAAYDEVLRHLVSNAAPSPAHPMPAGEETSPRESEPFQIDTGKAGRTAAENGSRSGRLSRGSPRTASVVKRRAGNRERRAVLWSVICLLVIAGLLTVLALGPRGLTNDSTDRTSRQDVASTPSPPVTPPARPAPTTSGDVEPRVSADVPSQVDPRTIAATSSPSPPASVDPPDTTTAPLSPATGDSPPSRNTRPEPSGPSFDPSVFDKLSHAEEKQKAKAKSAKPPNTKKKRRARAKSVAATNATNAEAKHAVPSRETQARIAEKLKELFPIDDVKTPSKARQRAKQLADEAKLARGSADEQYVLLSTATEMAGESGDAVWMTDLVDSVERQFIVDALAMKHDLLTRFAEQRGENANVLSLATASRAVVGQAVDDDRYELASSLAKAVCLATERAHEKQLAKEARDERSRVERLRQEWLEAEQARLLLETRPDDRQANLLLGRWRCFVKHDWSNGLPRLAKGGDATLASLAQRELSNPDTPEAQLAVADAWWGAARNTPGDDRRLLTLRAGDWYKHCLAKLPSGLDRLKAQKRLAEIAVIHLGD